MLMVGVGVVAFHFKRELFRAGGAERDPAERSTTCLRLAECEHGWAARRQALLVMSELIACRPSESL